MNEITKQDWVNFRANNIEVIIRSKVQIEAAEKVIELCNERIAEFPEDKIEVENDRT
jgi:hypothetical protein